MFTPMFHGQNRNTSFLPTDIPIDDPDNLYWVYVEDASYIDTTASGYFGSIQQTRIYPDKPYTTFYSAGDNLPQQICYTAPTTVNGHAFNYILIPQEAWNVNTYLNYLQSPAPLQRISCEYFGVLTLNPTVHSTHVGTVYYMELPEADGQYAKHLTVWIDSLNIKIGTIRIKLSDMSRSFTAYDTALHGLNQSAFNRIIISGNDQTVRLNGTEVLYAPSMPAVTSTIEEVHTYATEYVGGQGFKSGIDGYVYETIVYPRLLTGTEVDNVTDYLNNKFDVY